MILEGGLIGLVKGLNSTTVVSMPLRTEKSWTMRPSWSTPES
jgi:hypothetical protein